MTMIVVNINEIKAKLSEYLDAVAKGERVLICKRNQPIAELRAVEPKQPKRRTIGGVTGIVIPPAFFEPMPDEFLDAFETGDVFPDVATAKASRVAARRPAYGTHKPAKRKR